MTTLLHTNTKGEKMKEQIADLKRDIQQEQIRIKQQKIQIGANFAQMMIDLLKIKFQVKGNR